jgi:hypothetical protein
MFSGNFPTEVPPNFCTIQPPAELAEEEEGTFWKSVTELYDLEGSLDGDLDIM